MPVMAIGYIPQLLFSRKEIRDAFQVGDDTVTRWIEQGAPIVVEGRGNNVRYCAEVAALQAWRVVTNRAQRSKSLRPENLVNPPDVQSPYC